MSLGEADEILKRKVRAAADKSSLEKQTLMLPAAAAIAIGTEMPLILLSFLCNEILPLERI